MNVSRNELELAKGSKLKNKKSQVMPMPPRLAPPPLKFQYSVENKHAKVISFSPTARSENGAGGILQRFVNQPGIKNNPYIGSLKKLINSHSPSN